MSSVVVFTFPAGTDMPDLDEVAIPVLGGSAWLALGNIVAVLRRRDGRKTMKLQVPEGVTVGIEPDAGVEE